MIDTQAIKQKNDLLGVVSRDVQLEKVSGHRGGEYKGPCPFCKAGTDRFWVQPNYNGGHYHCRVCGADGDVISYVMKRDSLTFTEACQALNGGADLPKRSGPVAKRQPRKAYSPPLDDWQDLAKMAIDKCQEQLHANKCADALDYLHKRGLTDKTINRYQLGYSQGAKFGRLWIPQGVLIPSLAAGKVWYMKVCYLPGQKVRCSGSPKGQPHHTEARKPCPICGKVNKYGGVKGNRTAAIFGADDLAGAKAALFCEGEFNTMIAAQEIGDVIAVASLGGSATNRPDLATWGPYFLPLDLILAQYDTDEAGESGALALHDQLGDKVKLSSIPEREGVKDINDYFLAGGDLWQWISTELDFYAPAPALAIAR